MQAIIFIGAQAAGKSSFYGERFSQTHLRINLDMLRTRAREKRLFELCCDMRQSFVVDNTNPEMQQRACYLAPADAAGFERIGYYFASRAEELLTRNRQRSDPWRVPDKAILGTIAKLQRPSRQEGFERLFYVRLDTQSGFVVEPWRDES